MERSWIGEVVMRSAVTRWLVFVALGGIFVFSWLNMSATIWLADFPNLSQAIRKHDQVIMNGWGIVTVLSFVGILTMLFLNIRWHRKQAGPGPHRDLPDSKL
jgi:hypothetical protein